MFYYFVLNILNQMTFNRVSDRCNMKYECYMHPPMFPLEKNPQLLDQSIRRLLIRKSSHISFNN